MHSKSFIFFFLLLRWFCGALPASAQLADADMIVYTPSGKQQVQLFWKDEQGKVLGSLGHLKSYVERRKQRLAFAMNGGMYMEDRSPLGLFIRDGETVRKLNTRQGYGNFYLKPNGVFYINTAGKGFVCATENFKPGKDIRYATQSGPMLVTGGKIHPGFRKGSANVYVRNGVGILADGRMLFAMSKKEVNLYDFAVYFRQKGCRNALFLDGFVSRTYLPALNWLQTGGYFGVIIGAVE
jgi:uncharacterized protein YigE (DUF2233 family)